LKNEKRQKRMNQAREDYDKRWNELLDRGDRNASPVTKGEGLKFEHIPWPIHWARSQSKRHSTTIGLDDLTAEAISTFLLLSEESTFSATESKEQTKKQRKEKLRETMLRFHPDKFEGRVMNKVAESDKEMVREAVGIVVRVVGGLMGEG
jgi:hypothetical protein